MRIFVCLAILITFLFTVGSCKKSSDASTDNIIDVNYSNLEISIDEGYAKYISAVEMINSAGSFAADINLLGRFSMLDMERENNLTIGVKQIFGGGDSVSGEIDATSTASGFDAYYKDGYIYFNHSSDVSELGSYKYALSGEGFINMTLSMLATDVLFSQEDVFAFEAQNASYGIALRFEVNQSGMPDVLRHLASYEETGGVYIYDADEVSYEFSDVVVMMQLSEDGELLDIRLAMLYSAIHRDMEGAPEVASSLEIGMNLSQIGGVVIEYPVNLDSYQSLDDELE